MYTDNDNKIYVIVNKRHELGVIANAACHLTAGLTNKNEDDLIFHNYQAKGNLLSATICHYPIVVLQSKNSNQLLNVLLQCNDLKIPFNYFTTTMIRGSSDEQLKATNDTELQNMDFIGIAVFGRKEKLTPITKKFSVFK